MYLRRKQMRIFRFRCKAQTHKIFVRKFKFAINTTGLRPQHNTQKSILMSLKYHWMLLVVCNVAFHSMYALCRAQVGNQSNCQVSNFEIQNCFPDCHAIQAMHFNIIWGDWVRFTTALLNQRAFNALCETWLLSRCVQDMQFIPYWCSVSRSSWSYLELSIHHQESQCHAVQCDIVIFMPKKRLHLTESVLFRGRSVYATCADVKIPKQCPRQLLLDVRVGTWGIWRCMRVKCSEHKLLWALILSHSKATEAFLKARMAVY